MDLNRLAPLDVLDAEELFTLGLRASTANDSAAALAYLKLALSRDPAHAKAHWAIAAEYATLRMPERATEHFARTVELDPGQPVARFQFGLLRLTCGDIPAAAAIWAPLDELDADDPVRLFKRGLLHMVIDEFDEALSLLRAAAAGSAVEPALRKDMEMTIARIETAQAAGPSNAPTAWVPAAEAASNDDLSLQSHLALTAYATGKDGH